MILLVYKNDLVNNPNVNIGNCRLQDIREGLHVPSSCDCVIAIDECNDFFRILKHRYVSELRDVKINDVRNLVNFI